MQNPLSDDNGPQMAAVSAPCDAVQPSSARASEAGTPLEPSSARASEPETPLGNSVIPPGWRRSSIHKKDMGCSEKIQ
ncbi:uncharacterized protein LOC135378795 isoform X3 [Ornithodoros turicata]|uniref:uncharacterized protein LOC135378795 isoform X3 n=1 Tax=Ornithodoros turicata TaxID=34597 RepID=UPI003139A15A